MQGTSPEKEHATQRGTACHVHVWFHPVHMLGPGTACRVQVQKKNMPHTVALHATYMFGLVAMHMPREIEPLPGMSIDTRPVRGMCTELHPACGMCIGRVWHVLFLDAVMYGILWYGMVWYGILWYGMV